MLNKIFELWREYSSKSLLAEAFITDKRGMLRTRARRAPPQIIVIHHTVTSSAKKTFMVLKQRGYSTHYEIDQAGNIHEYVDPTTRVAIHAGNSIVNAKSIGIDLTGNLYKNSATPAQKASLYALVSELCDRFNIPRVVAPDGNRNFRTAKKIINNGIGIVRHRNIRPTACPGKIDLFYLESGASAPRLTGAPQSPGSQPGAPVKPSTPRAAPPSKRGRFKSKFKSFAAEHPDFSFAKFYQELKDLYPGALAAALPRHGPDNIFGKEHYNAWLELQNIKKNKGLGAQTPATQADVPPMAQGRRGEKYWFGKD